MARDSIQLPSDGAGKALLAFTETESGAPSPNAGVRYVQGLVVCDANGNVQHRPYGPLRVSQDEHYLFLDTHDQALDTTSRWNAATGTKAPSVSASVLQFGTATTASAYGKLTSQPTFRPLIPGFIQPSFAIKLDAAGAAATGGHRFFGLGTSPTTPTTAAPLTDAIGWEVGTDGKLYAVVYASGSRTAVDLSAVQPLDGLYHRYLIQARTDFVYFFLDSLSAPVATMTWTTPNTQDLPLLLQTVNPSSGVSGGGYPLLVQGTVVADTASNGVQLSDGTNPWRKLAIDSAGRASVDPRPLDSAVSASLDATSTASVAAASTANGRGTVMFQVTGTWTGTLVFEATVDGTNWVAVMADALGLLEQSISSTTVNGLYRVNASGLSQIRVRVGTAGTGTAVVTGIVSTQAPPESGPTPLRGTSNAGGAAGTPATGATLSSQQTGFQPRPVLDVRLVEDGVGGALAQSSANPLYTVPAQATGLAYMFVTSEITLATSTGVKEMLTFFRVSAGLASFYLAELRWVPTGTPITAGRANWEFQHITAENGTPGGTTVSATALNRGNALSNMTIRQGVTGAPTTTASVYERRPLLNFPQAATQNGPPNEADGRIFDATKTGAYIVMRAAQNEGLRVTLNILATLTGAQTGYLAGTLLQG